MLDINNLKKQNMKKIFVSLLVSISLFATTQAQTATANADGTSAGKTLSKEEKEAAKTKKEADLVDAFTKAGLSADEQKKVRAVLDESNEKTKPIKADASLSDDAKKEKLDAIYKERNEQLKTVMGNEKYKAFKAAQKAQKEAALAAGQ